MSRKPTEALHGKSARDGDPTPIKVRAFLAPNQDDVGRGGAESPASRKVRPLPPSMDKFPRDEERYARRLPMCFPDQTPPQRVFPLCKGKTLRQNLMALALVVCVRFITSVDGQL